MDNKYYQFNILKKYSNLIELYSKKPININLNQVTEEELSRTYNEISKDFNYVFKTIKRCHQNHTDNIALLTETNLNDYLDNFDGIITNLKGVALAISTADCQSIFLYDPQKEVIGNIHSGWRGTLNSIVTKAINLMVNNYNCNPKDIIVCISPSIGKCCFEVDEDVYLLFKEKYSFIDDLTSKKLVGKQYKYYIDTKELNKKILLDLGISKQNIEISDICTKCSYETYYSFRQEKTLSGRNLSLIALKEEK